MKGILFAIILLNEDLPCGKPFYLKLMLEWLNLNFLKPQLSPHPCVDSSVARSSGLV